MKLCEGGGREEARRGKRREKIDGKSGKRRRERGGGKWGSKREDKGRGKESKRQGIRSEKKQN